MPFFLSHYVGFVLVLTGTGNALSIKIVLGAHAALNQAYLKAGDLSFP
jgi:hypothetical protein